jgi:micrococcal nuclease
VIVLLGLLACTDGTTGTDDTATDTATDTVAIRPDVDPSTLPVGDNPCREPVLMFVDYVVDGDTAYMTPDGSSEQEKVRFIGIDTPEMGYQGSPDDCYGPEATAETERLIEDRWVYLTFDAECEDYYDRTLAYLHLSGDEDGFVNRSLVRAGLAWEYAVSPNVSFEAEFQQDELAAEQADAGLWSACGA